MTSVTSDRRQGINSSAAIKVACQVATTGNISLTGLQLIDGVMVAAGDRVLVKAQTLSSQNGIYTADTGNWSRALDFDGAYDVLEGTIITVLHGTTNASSLWKVSTVAPTIGSALLFAVSSLSPTDANSVTYTPAGAGAVPRTMQGRERDMITALDYMTDAERADILGYAYALDVSVDLQKAWDFANSIGAEVWHPPGGYKANNLTLKDHTIVRGPLTNRGEWWNSTNKGAVLKNTHAANNTVNGESAGLMTLSSAVVGMNFESTTTSGAHIALPTGSNHVLIKGNCFQGAADGIVGTGQVYETEVRRNMFSGQTNDCIRLSNSGVGGGVDFRMEYNVFRAMGRSAFRVDGTTEFVLIVFHNNYCDSMAGTGDYFSLIKACRQVSVQHNDFELVASTAWAVTMRGDGNTVAHNKITNTAANSNGIQFISATANILGPHLITAGAGGIPVRFDAGSVGNVITWNTAGAGAIINDLGANNFYCGDGTGTWIPTIGAGLTVVGALSKLGTYKRIGNVVWLRCELWAATTIASTGGATATITGFPFAPERQCVASGAASDLTPLANSLIDTSAGGTLFAPAFGATAAHIIITAAYNVL